MNACRSCHRTHELDGQIEFEHNGSKYRANVERVERVVRLDAVLGDAVVEMRLCIVEITG